MPSKLEITTDLVAAVLADAETEQDITRNRSGYEWRPAALSPLTIGEKLLGFDPSRGKHGAAYGGKSPDGWMNEHLSMTKLRAALRQLTEDGVIVQVSDCSHPRTAEERLVARAVRFPYRARTGYVHASHYRRAVAAVEEAERDKTRAGQRKLAERQVLARHQDEVDAAYQALCAQAGLDPELERPAR